ncbi:XkdX family protein [Fructilactobacillus vespulae]
MNTFEFLKMLYGWGQFNDDDIKNALDKGDITKDEYNAIVNTKN